VVFIQIYISDQLWLEEAQDRREADTFFSDGEQTELHERLCNEAHIDCDTLSRPLPSPPVGGAWQHASTTGVDVGGVYDNLVFDVSSQKTADKPLAVRVLRYLVGQARSYDRSQHRSAPSPVGATNIASDPNGFAIYPDTGAFILPATIVGDAGSISRQGKDAINGPDPINIPTTTYGDGHDSTASYTVAICQYVPTKPDPLPCARQTNDSNRSEASSSGARAVASHAHLPGEWLVETPDGAMPSVRPQSRQPAYSAGLWSQKFGLPSIAFFVCTRSRFSSALAACPVGLRALSCAQHQSGSSLA
jgi:hypothetical protein